MARKKLIASKDVRNSGGGRIFNANGELEASSTRDAIAQLLEASAVLNSGAEIVTDTEAQTRAQRVEAAQQIFTDPDAHRQIGIEMANTITMTANKEGFARRFLGYQELVDGERPEIEIDDRNVQAVISTGPAEIATQVVRDRRLTPPEYDISARPFVENKEIKQSKRDILQSKFNEGLEAVMVQEDRTYKRMIDSLIETNGQRVDIVGGLVPGVLGSGMDRVVAYGLPFAHILMSSSLATTMMTSREFENIIDPVTRLEIFRTGQIATLYGATVNTDMNREKRLRVLNADEIYYISEEQYHGQYTDRGGVESEPINQSHEGKNGKGWHMNELFSAAVINYRSVSLTSVK